MQINDDVEGPAKIGYGRVSTEEQSLDLQDDELTRAGCDIVFFDKCSGLKTQRPKLDDALSHLRRGDTFIVWRLDRVGRSIRHLIDFIDDLNKRGVNFVSLQEKIDTSTVAGRFFFNIMAALAEMERELIVERTRAGLEAARKRGRVGGRRLKFDARKKEMAKKSLEDGVPPRDVAESLGVSIATLYRHLPAKKRK